MARLDIETGRKLWDEAARDYQPKWERALKARAALDQKMIAAGNGTGMHPSDIEYDMVAALFRDAEHARLQMDEISRSVFGI